MAKLSNVHTERIFENELCDHLATNGWAVLTHPKEAASYSRELALFPDDLLAFVQETQPAEWAKFKKWHNGQSEAMFVKRVAEQLDKHGTLHLLRHGFKDRDAKFFLCQFRPANKKNPQLWAWYEKNRLTVIRQLHYSLHNENSIDLVHFLNGLPVSTAELKTDLTQNIKDAIIQYKKDRLPKDAKSKEPEALLQFKTRALVHFAVSTDEVFMTTKLDGEKTYFLPFNLGRPDGVGGATAGNPPAPEGKGYPTWYLWEQVWAKDVWLDILGNFLHLEVKQDEDPKTGKKRVKETLIFPRFHQLDVVRNLVDTVAQEGAGQVYLVQHSAGSGKSNSIAWSAHRMANLHDAADNKIFDSVIVITDRRVLDKQLQETISQFEHKSGVVQKIDKNSQQLAEALMKGTPVVVTTIQKFPFILDKVKGMKGKRFAIIVDEAHSSQSGTAARNMKIALTSGEKSLSAPAVQVELDGETVEVPADVEIDPEDVTSEDVVNEVMSSRMRPKNVSYFAFTATPKGKTMELFGRPNAATGLPEPFHVYSMRQAIEEGFILDVLKNYTSYKMFYKLGALSDEKLVPQGKAKAVLARYAILHPHNIAQKVVVIVEHFREHVASKIGGQAKAMVVTGSRKAAVRYKLAIDRYIKERGYQTELRTLVAFSGKVEDPDSGPDDFTEASMNPGIGGVEPSEAFKGDDYRILLVANKYQTGFDQPLLHTMYVDKRLSGVLAVQTLSRLNRILPGKDDTFVLDFVNKPDEILESFKPYYRAAELEDVTDPNIVHELQIKLDQAGVYFPAEVDGFAQVFFDPKRKQASLHQFLKPAADRFFHSLEEEAAEQFRRDLGTFLRLYDFLSQIVPYNDSDLEKRYAFGKNLMPRIAEHGSDTAIDLDSDVRLTHYRLQGLGQMRLDLSSGEIVKLQRISEAGSGKGVEDEKKPLAEVVEKMNDLFSGDLTEADLIGYVTTLHGKLLEDETLAEQAANNTEEQFRMGDFKDRLTDIILDSQDAHNSIAGQLLKDERIFAAMQGMLAKMVYRAFAQRQPSEGDSI
ncbi:DEAD/DEAH box helicase family protein [Castellaniella sp. FW104-16D08]|uniref:type I restriction endonuclease subunit R n=1 Tax=unclassified Castellaniella TaxID=2617606 RepID=UPI003314E83D